MKPLQKLKEAIASGRPFSMLVVCLQPESQVLLSTPLIRCVHKRFPQAVIHYALQTKCAPLLEGNPYVHKIIKAGAELSSLPALLQGETYDCIISLEPGLRPSTVSKIYSRVPLLACPVSRFRKWYTLLFKKPAGAPEPEAERYLQSAAPLGVETDGLGLDFFIPEQARIKKDDLPFSHLQGYIVVIIHAPFYTQKMPPAKISEILSRIHYPVVLLGGEEERVAGNEIAAADEVKIYNACGKFSLHEMGDILQKAQLVISHDSYLMHMAAALKKNILSVWGSNSPAFGGAPYKTLYETYEIKKLRCHPCSVTGFDDCPRTHFKCMNQQRADRILAGVHSMLGRTN